ncbi:MAG: phenylalanine--tRNA ligase subunit alpha [Deltaproteobacteria bacterium]|nr:phenylalanine--tRNA ligase subunit alpha [Deltaproteobacteria bacterium]
MPSSTFLLIRELAELESAFRAEVASLATEQEIRAAQARYLGKKGRVSELMKQMGRLPAEERPQVGEVANRTKNGIEAETERRLCELRELARKQDLERQVDVTLPGRCEPVGHLHILTKVRREIVAIFAELGFEVAFGPQVETDFHNFEALGIPKDHPARDMQDTFYVADDVVLRTHTSPVQIRTMLSKAPPVKIVAPGAVYRKDDDPTHSPMFQQIEGLLVDEDVRMSDLKGVLLHFVRRFFGRDLGIRFRPSYFPFVEPGAEVDMQCTFCGGRGAGCRVCKGTGFLEIGGAGMVDPVVLKQVNYDAEKFNGFAFGMGIERMAMLRHGINDIKLFYEGNLRFLEQF